MGILVDEAMSVKQKATTVRRKIFVAAPMSGFNSDHEYGDARQAIGELTEQLIVRKLAKEVYFAGTNVSGASNFTDNIAALHADVGALRKSDVFVMVYPRTVVTGALVEAGIALERNMPMVLLVGKEAELPYFLRKGNETALSGLPVIRVARFKDYASLASEGIEEIDALVRTL